MTSSGRKTSNTTDIKFLLVALSLAGTLAGWALFSQETVQTQSLANTSSAAAITMQAANPANGEQRSSPQLRQVAAPSQPITSRSSR